MRSGKSRHALTLALRYPPPRVFIATAQPIDDEMRERIAKHQAERGGRFHTIEEPIYLASRLMNLQIKASIIVVDCLTLWLSNLLHDDSKEDSELPSRIDECVDVASKIESDIVFVTNEVGLGIVPEHVLARQFIDHLGFLNQKFATLCDEVIFMVAGIPQQIKGETKNEGVDAPLAAH